MSLQAAWDKSDIAALRVMMTDTMLKEIQAQLTEREAHTGGPVNRTDVVMIEAQLLGIEDLGDEYMASVEFSGMIREEPSAGPSPFREVWNMTKRKIGSVAGWWQAFRRFNKHSQRPSPGSTGQESAPDPHGGRRQSEFRNNRGLWQHSPLFHCWRVSSKIFLYRPFSPLLGWSTRFNAESCCCSTIF